MRLRKLPDGSASDRVNLRKKRQRLQVYETARRLLSRYRAYWESDEPSDTKVIRDKSPRREAPSHSTVFSSGCHDFAQHVDVDPFDGYPRS